MVRINSEHVGFNLWRCFVDNE